ncbi:MAG: hypothetical protein JXO22_02910 [Phycisphaerae bacterium]|nr:hypothetical protein [Phycisphaerae bacterium]
MSEEIKDAIVENATGPRKATGDEGSIEQHSLQDQIAADWHVKGTNAAKKPARGLRFTKLIMPGTSS